MTFIHGAKTFEELLHHTRVYGEKRSSRTGIGTRSLFAPDPLRFDLTDNHVALITSKAVPWKMALREYMWMLSGSTNTDDLRKSSPAMANLWDLWATDGDIGPTYGAQYRNAGGSLMPIFPTGQWAVPEQARGVDQLREVVKRLAETPDTRRALISLWSVPELRDMSLEPCMVLFQFSRRGPRFDQLDLHIYQRSADMMLGVPFDLFQGSFLLHAVAREIRLAYKQEVYGHHMTWSAGDVHIYENQIDAADIQLKQWAQAEPMRARMGIDPFPSLRLLDGTLEAGHVSIHDYNPAPAIDAGKPAV
ncbi:thymidylate synthase [Microbacterium phage Coltrane]|uniref:thymidylate synthase n=2 Tax=Armstrongvirus armstrong TaxID=2734217 RepID=A0A3G2KAE1_9CAUD|nr:thymidylate synthase [Microbacterium phage Brahms]AYN57395.1 thymidylate synthase [Microbacterium phage Coltrane]